MRITPVFQKNWNVAPDKRWVVNRGGTRSSKTYSLCQIALVWLFTGQFRQNVSIPSGNFSIVRKHGTTLAKTVMRDFEEVLKESGLAGLVKQNKNERTYRVGDRFVEFVGADDAQKMRGFKSAITWMNEANELDWDVEVKQLRLRTEKYILVDFNPSDPHVWMNENLELGTERRRQKLEVIVSTYKDNPYISAEQIAEIEDTRDDDPDDWLVYGEGQYGKVRGLVFPNVKIVEEMPQNLKHRGFGMDFGYKNGVTTLIECGLANEKDVYFDQCFYQYGMSPEEISTALSGLGISKLPVAADPAGGWTIEHLQADGFNVFGADKGPDSVAYGIDLLNQYNLHITAQSADMLKERLKYRYRTESNGKNLNIPVDAWNHAWDAARYWAITYLKPRRKSRSAYDTPGLYAKT